MIEIIYGVLIVTACCYTIYNCKKIKVLKKQIKELERELND